MGERKRFTTCRSSAIFAPVKTKKNIMLMLNLWMESGIELLLDVRALDHIAAGDGGCTMSSLIVGGVANNAPHVTMIADRLEKLGLVERFREPEDRRSVFLRATPAGRALL